MRLCFRLALVISVHLPTAFVVTLLTSGDQHTFESSASGGGKTTWTSPVSVVSVFSIITITAVLGHMLCRWTVTAWFSEDPLAHTVTTQPGGIIKLSIDFSSFFLGFCSPAVCLSSPPISESDSYRLITLFRLTKSAHTHTLSWMHLYFSL